MVMWARNEVWMVVEHFTISIRAGNPPELYPITERYFIVVPLSHDPILSASIGTTSGPDI